MPVDNAVKEEVKLGNEPKNLQEFIEKMEAQTKEPAPQQQEAQPPQSPDKAGDAKLEKSWRKIQDMKKSQEEMDEFKKVLEGFKKDPYATAEKFGLKYEDWTKKVLSENLSDKRTDEIAQQLEEIKEFKRKLEGERKLNEQALAKNERIKQIGEYVKANDMWLIDAMGASDDVDVYLQNQRSNGNPIDYEEAAEKVNKYLIDLAQNLGKNERFLKEYAQQVAVKQTHQTKSMNNKSTDSRKFDEDEFNELVGSERYKWLERKIAAESREEK